MYQGILRDRIQVERGLKAQETHETISLIQHGRRLELRSDPWMFRWISLLLKCRRHVEGGGFNVGEEESKETTLQSSYEAWAAEDASLYAAKENASP